MAKIKIAIVCSTLNQLGGPAAHIRNIYTYLNGPEFRFKLIFCSLDENALREYMLSGGVALEDMIFVPHAQKRALLPFILALRGIFLKERFDIVDAFETQAQALAGVAARMAGVKKFVCHCEAQFLPSTISLPKRMLFRALNWFLKDYFTLSLAVSKGLARELVSSGFRPADRVRVLHPGIRVPGEPSRLPFSGDTVVIGTIARLSEEKGLDRFVRAAGIIAQAVPQARFVIHGEGKEKESLQRLIREKGLRARFDLKPWTRDVTGEMQKLDVYVFPSLREGLPIALLEAMAAARPCVASDIEGVRDVIENEAGGILTDTADPEGFARVITDLCRDTNCARKIGQKGRAKVTARFHAQQEMDKLGGIYRDAVETRDKTGSAGKFLGIADIYFIVITISYIIWRIWVYLKRS